MYYVYVIRGGNECLVGYHSVGTLIPPDALFYTLNVNYLDDIREIEAAVSVFPSRIDGADRWLTCDLINLMEMIRQVIAARMNTRVPLGFLRMGQQIVSLGCVRVRSRRLPRDILREVAGWLRVAAVATLAGIFETYIYLENITGLNLRVCAAPGPRLFVRGVRTRLGSSTLHVGKNSHGHVRSIDYGYHSCGRHPMLHFYVYLDPDALHFMGIANTARASTYKVEFHSTEDAMVFEHKNPRKRAD